MKEKLKKLWAILDGNKTIIGTSIIGVLSYCPLPQPYQAILITVVGILTGVSLEHHRRKGYLSTRKR